MKIKQIVSQHRRDLTVIYICENCGDEYKGYGYDDTHFHSQVIPNMKCTRCGEKAPKDFQALTTRYSKEEVI